MHITCNLLHFYWSSWMLAKTVSAKSHPFCPLWCNTSIQTLFLCKEILFALHGLVFKHFLCKEISFIDVLECVNVAFLSFMCNWFFRSFVVCFLALGTASVIMLITMLLYVAPVFVWSNLHKQKFLGGADAGCRILVSLDRCQPCSAPLGSRVGLSTAHFWYHSGSLKSLEA